MKSIGSARARAFCVAVALACWVALDSADQGGTLIGRAVPPASVVDQTGKPVTLQYKGTPTVLFIISSGCGWCEQNSSGVAVLAEKVGARYRFVALSVTPKGAVDYRKRLVFPVYAIPDPHADSWEAYALGPTPTLMVISGDAKIVRVWSGSLAGDRKASVEEFFGVKLPDISQQ